MLNLAEYRQRPALLADWLPWAGLVAPGVVLNKDGSFQRTARFRGPDLDSATQGELVATTARLNNALRRLGVGWALFVEAERRPAADYPHSDFPEPLSWLVDEERRATFEESGNHFESGYHLTLQYLPPEESRARAAKLLYENTPSAGVDWRERLTAFVAETGRIFDLLDGVMPEIDWLDDAETLTYLHATVSTRRYRIGVPDVPFHLDALLADAPLIGGLAPMLGDAHLRVVTVRGFPTSTWPGILDDLNRLGFAYRWSTRFLCMDKAEAEKELVRLRRQWFAKRKNVLALLRETIFQQESPLVDTDASNKAADADAALQELGSDQVAFGYVTATVTVLDADADTADEKLRMVERVIQGRGFVTIPETLNSVEAWLSSVPGNTYANVRQPIVSTLNLAHLMPVSAVWAGPEKNDHLDGPPLIVTRTEGATPFRLVTHIGDVGHTLVAGPTGMGKSVLLATLAMQFRRYPGSRIFAFDMGPRWAWAANTMTWVPMARSRSNRSRASTKRATAPGPPNGLKVACNMKASPSAPTRRRPFGRRSAALPARRSNSARSRACRYCCSRTRCARRLRRMCLAVRTASCSTPITTGWARPTCSASRWKN
jgi:type IV secretion system protein VirB4